VYGYFHTLVLPVYLQVKALITSLATQSWSEHDNEEQYLYPCLDRIQFVGFRFPRSWVWRLRVQVFWDVLPCCVDPDVQKAHDAFASKVKGSRTSEEPCFNVECLTLEAEGIMVLWYARNHLTDKMASHTRRHELSAILLWKPQIFCECEECSLLGCNIMYSGRRIPVCLEATLYYVNRFKTFYIGRVVPVHQTTWCCFSECGSLQNHGWSLCSHLLYWQYLFRCSLWCETSLKCVFYCL
jgi:hypothetical protein